MTKSEIPPTGLSTIISRKLMNLGYVLPPGESICYWHQQTQMGRKYKYNMRMVFSFTALDYPQLVSFYGAVPSVE